MKTNNFKLLSVAGGLLLGSSLLFTACSDDKEQPNLSSGKSLSFSANIEENYQSPASASRSGGGTFTTATVETIDGATTSNGDQLYLHTLETDSIGAPVQQVDGSRATPITTATMYNSFGLIGYEYSSSNTWATLASTLTPTFYQVPATKGTDGVWKTSNTDWAWNAGQQTAIFAYAPNTLSSSVLSFSAQTTPGAPTMTYTVPTNVQNQQDLLVADSVDVTQSASNTPLALRFRHALTAVRFVTGNNFIGGTVTSIQLKNVYSTATYDMNSNRGTGGWSAHSTPATYSQYLYQGASSTPKSTITEGMNTFFMLPQTLPAGAEIEITLVDSLSNSSRTLTKSIAGTTWKKGKTVVYNISTNNFSVVPNFTLSTNTLSTTYKGGMLSTVTLTSTSTVTGGGTTTTGQTPWTAQYSTDNGATWSSTAPDWLSNFPSSATNSYTFSGRIAKQNSVVRVSAQNTALQALTTSKTDFDLSTNATYNGSAPRNTANCYIVNEPGTYRLPLVYGNAIKNGGTNTSAYASSTSGSGILSPLQNHLGYGITNPYLAQNSGVVPNNATLVWMDADSLVTNVSYAAEGNGYIKFEVPKKHIQQGNAILAIRDASNTILWSWHIWVTNYVLGTGDATITGSNKAYTFMSKDVGWCDPAVYTHPERSVQIKFTQKGTNATQTLTITQTTETYQTIGDAPYYQWGRKDPMLPYVTSVSSGTVTSNSADKASYATISSYNFTKTLAQVNLSTGIQTPHTFYYQSDISKHWITTTIPNLWSINEKGGTRLTTTTPVKTVYDPSPVGYMVMPPNAYANFTQANSSWNNLTKMKTLISGGSITVPALSSRPGENYYKGNIFSSGIGQRAFYWSSVYNWFFDTYPTLVRTNFSGAGTTGATIRSVKE